MVKVKAKYNYFQELKIFSQIVESLVFPNAYELNPVRNVTTIKLKIMQIQMQIRKDPLSLGKVY